MTTLEYWLDELDLLNRQRHAFRQQIQEAIELHQQRHREMLRATQSTEQITALIEVTRAHARTTSGLVCWLNQHLTDAKQRVELQRESLNQLENEHHELTEYWFDLVQTLNKSTLVSRPILIVSTFTYAVPKVGYLFEYTVQTFQTALDSIGNHLRNKSAEYFAEHSDMVDILGKLDPDTRNILLRQTDIDENSWWWTQTYSFMRTVRCQIGLNEIWSIFGANHKAGIAWTECKSKAGHRATWDWLRNMNEEELEPLVSWYNRLPSNRVLRT
jgi:hypothetical protein